MHLTHVMPSECPDLHDRLISWTLHAQGGGGGDTLIFSHIRRLGLFFGGFKILNFNIIWGFRKMNIFWGYEDLGNIFGVITKLG